MQLRYFPSTYLALVAAVLTACSKPDPVAELEKSAAAMEKAGATPAAAGDAEPTPTVAPAQEVKQAVADFKAGKMEDAVTRLQILRAQPALTPDQRMALQDSIATVVAEIYALAEKGDARAAAAVIQYERMQTRR